MQVNGKQYSLSKLNVHTVQDLIQYFHLSADRVAVEKNGEIVPKKNYVSEPLQENDKIEIIHFVGGG